MYNLVGGNDFGDFNGKYISHHPSPVKKLCVARLILACSHFVLNAFLNS